MKQVTLNRSNVITVLLIGVLGVSSFALSLVKHSKAADAPKTAPTTSTQATGTQCPAPAVTSATEGDKTATSSTNSSETTNNTTNTTTNKEVTKEVTKETHIVSDLVKVHDVTVTVGDVLSDNNILSNNLNNNEVNVNDVVDVQDTVDGGVNLLTGVLHVL